MMKSCLGWVAVYFVVAGGLAVWFLIDFPEAPPNVSPRLPPLSARAATATGFGLVCAIPGVLGLAGLDGIRTRLGERRALRAAADGEPPVDGAVQPFVGRIVGRGPGLTAPLSGRSCLMYHYKATHSSGGKSSSTITDAEGYALAPSSIQTPCGHVAVRAYLEPEFTPDTLDAENSRARLDAYQRTVTLFSSGFDLVAYYRHSQQYLLDDDGAVRYDHGSQGSAADARRFEEHVLQTGDDVVVFGMYSGARGAIVPDPQNEIMHRARLRKGSVAKVARRLAWEAFGSGATGVFFFAGAVAVGWFLFAKGGTFS